MSIQSMTNRDVFTIKRGATTQGTEGGPSTVYTTASRGSLPTSVRGRFQPLSSSERVAYGIRGEVAAYKGLFHTDPQIDERDRFEVTDSSGVTHACRVINPSRDLDNQGRLYVVIGEEMSNRT